MTYIPISATIITYNEAHILERTLQSLDGVVDEIVILDSGSTDNTKAIAARYNVKWHEQPFAGFGAQKNAAISYASHDWVLCIDADEVLSPKLQYAIKTLKDGSINSFSGYSFSLLNNYLGGWIKHGGWYPDNKPRLFNKNWGAWSLDDVHEKWQFHSTVDVMQTLPYDLHHYTITSYEQHIEKIRKYASLSAQKAIQKGKTCSAFKARWAPQWFFFNKYYLRLGFLDGYEGYLFNKMQAMEKFIKYTKIHLHSKSK